MTFYEFVKASNWANVSKKLLEFYPGLKEGFLPRFKRAYETLRNETPAPDSDWMLIVEDNFCGGANVYMRPYHCADENDILYDLEGIPWRTAPTQKSLHT